jgi:PA-IL-like protein
MLKRTILALAVVALTIPGLAAAQENATLIMKSGERVSGHLVDFGAGGFAMRVNGQDRKIRTNEVAVLDFAGGDTSSIDWSQVTGGKHVVWLRNGQTVTGQFYDVSGNSPKRITVKTDAGDREFTSNEISRIALAPMGSGTAATTGSTAGTAPEGQGIAVPGNQQWTSTGLTVRQGEVLTFQTTGEVQFTPDPNDMAPAAGSKAQKKVGGAPLPDNFAGALIARIGNGQPFAIGNQTSVPMPEAGQLFLGINDDNVSDNKGGFRVNVQRSNRRR